MPLNEITAVSYSILHYTTPAEANRRHAARIYLGAALTPIADDEWELTGFNNPATSSDWLLSEIWSEIFERKSTTFAEPVINDIEVWEPETGENTFLGYSATFTPTGSFGSQVAAAYLMYVFRTQTREKFRFTYFDTLTYLLYILPKLAVA